MSKMRIAIAGFGKTGRALLDFLLEDPWKKEKYEQIYLYNDTPITDLTLTERYEARGVKFLIGTPDFHHLEDTGTLVLSPGIDGRRDCFSRLRAQGVDIVSEIEFASRFFSAPVIGVTGTNGKSTTVSLIHHILQENGINSLLLGNIGTPLISMVKEITPDSVVVLELSSFQLEEIVDFKPHIALLLNVTPDHLDRYPGMDDYLEAKLNLFKNQEFGDYVVVNYDDTLLRSKAGTLGRGKENWFSLDFNKISRGGYIEGNRIILKQEESKKSISLEKNPLRGLHNLQNLLAACIAAHLCGVSARGIETSIPGFRGLEHRMEPVARIGEVEFINDSKATNVDAALKSIGSIYESLVLILGGKDKGSDFTLLRDVIKERVDRVLLVGAAAQVIYRQLSDLQDRLEFVEDFSGAVSRGHQLLAQKGGVVLLAPACASFDMFDNYEHRGQVFKEEVRALKEKMEKNG